VFAGVERVDRHRRVEKVRRADAHRIDVGGRQQLLVVPEDRGPIDVVLLLDALSGLRVNVRERDDLGVRVLLIAFDMTLTWSADADDPNSQLVHTLSSLSGTCCGRPQRPVGLPCFSRADALATTYGSHKLQVSSCCAISIVRRAPSCAIKRPTPARLRDPTGRVARLFGALDQHRSHGALRRAVISLMSEQPRCGDLVPMVRAGAEKAASSGDKSLARTCWSVR
jgi:hypothetical protein